MTRKRSHNISIPNLYCKLDKRTGKVYWQYFHGIRKKFIGFGTDEQAARAAATELNRIIEEQRANQSWNLTERLLAESEATASTGMKVRAWIDQYQEILQKRLQRRQLAASTVRNRITCSNILRDRLPNTLITEMGAREMAALLEEYIDADKARMAQLMRSVWIDVFREAQYAGEVPPGFNPAMATRSCSAEVRRSRLFLEDWRKIWAAAQHEEPYVRNSFMLALITGQRLGDIVNMQFSQVKDDHLYITQEKRGARIALPLKLFCHELNMTLTEAISRCRDNVVSRYMVHHVRSHRRAAAGSMLNRTTVSNAFADLRDAVGIKPQQGKTPATFHEIRSLSERIYREQGINTQILLGHKTAKMTEHYNDERSDNWKFLTL